MSNNIFHKVGNTIDALKSFSTGSKPFYAKLNDGTNSYNYEMDRNHLFKFWNKNKYYRPLDDYRGYYDKIGYLADLVDLIADIVSQAEIREVRQSDYSIVEDSRFIALLDKPNPFQTRQEFIKEDIINILTNGVGIQWSNFFLNGDLKVTNKIYNIRYANLKLPKVKNPYLMTERELESLQLKETLADGKERLVAFKELAYVYDIGKENNCASDVFFNPISRLKSIRYDLQIMMNTSDTMAYLSDNPVMGILSKKGNANDNAPLAGEEKGSIEHEINSKGKYGASVNGKGSLIASNEEFSLLSLTPDVKKLMLIEQQNNAKENIRSRFNIPRDISDAVSGGNRGSTYENKQTAEAFLINAICKGILDKRLASYQKRAGLYFERNGTFLEGTFDHLPSIQAFNSESLYKGLVDKMDAYTKAQDSYRTYVELSTKPISYEEYMINQGFDETLLYKEQ